MANIESLHGSDKLREAYPKVNKNFNAIDKEVTDLRSRVNNIITTPIDGEAAAQEVVDARNSAAKSKIFDTLGARLEEIEQDNASVAQELAAHKAETMSYYTHVTRDLSLDGEQIISGLPFIPKVIFIDTFVRTTVKQSKGVVTQNGSYSVTVRGDTEVIDVSASPIHIMDSGSNQTRATVTINPDKTLTLNWTKTGDGATGSAMIRIVALSHGHGGA